MGESETGIMATRGEPFSFSIQKPPGTSQPGVQGMRLAYNADGSSGAPIYKPITSTSPSYPLAGNGNAAVGVDVSAPMSSGGAPPAVVPPGVNMNVSVSSTSGPTGEQPARKKRGRPRKYGPDGTVALAMASGGAPVSVGPPSGGFSPSAGHGCGSAGVNISGGNGNLPGSVSPTNSVKKSRGRPPGSGKKHRLDTLGSAGLGFTPHVITVKAGEDVSSKIMSLSQNGPRALCILSANGAISNVTLRQPAISGGTVTYEGRFEILSLSGSFLLSENEGHRSRTGGLSVSLSGPDGRVLGGGVAGLLTAASPVQVVVGSFVPDGQKEPKPMNHMEHYSAPTKIPPVGGLTGGSSPSHGTLSESSGGAGSPLNHSTGACNNNNPAMSSTPWK